MPWTITKYLITAAIVVAVFELTKRSNQPGALLASLPLVTLLALTWLYLDKQSAKKIANHAWYTFPLCRAYDADVPCLSEAVCTLRFLALIDAERNYHTGVLWNLCAGRQAFQD